MGLDIVIIATSTVRCPHCGLVVSTSRETVDSHGSEWNDFLKYVRYYERARGIPEADDLLFGSGSLNLTGKQALYMLKYAKTHEVMAYDDVVRFLRLAIERGDEISINVW